MKLEAKNLLDALSEKEINYKLFEHEAFFTVEESSKLKNDLDMQGCLLYTSPSPRDAHESRMPSSA